MTKQLFNEKQARLNDVLQQFAYKLEQRPGSVIDRPAALSTSEQENDSAFDHECTSGRVMQLLPKVSTNQTTFICKIKTLRLVNDLAIKAKLFEK